MLCNSSDLLRGPNPDLVPMSIAVFPVTFSPVATPSLRTLFDLNVKDISQCVMPGVKKSNDVELQLHESDATDQTEVSIDSSLIC